MIKIENIETSGWEAAIRRLYRNKGVYFRPPTSYEGWVQSKGKNIYCGTYSTKQEAYENVVKIKCELFKKYVSRYETNINKIVESTIEGYFVSPSGNVYNRHGVRMKGAIDRCGYRHINLNKKSVNVHRLIAETFIPNPNNLSCVNHKDGNKLNNCVENLEWCTYSENTIHSYAHNLQKVASGEEHRNHKLDWDKVKYIRQFYKKRDKQFGATALAKKFNVSRSTVLSVIHNESWRENN